MDKRIIQIKRKKSENKQAIRSENVESHITYFRANPHRLITDWFGLRLYDFQRLLLYTMHEKTLYIYIASRGGAKSTLALLFAIAMATLYPETQIVVVTPVKKQAGRFIEKIKELYGKSYNLQQEIDFKAIQIGDNNNVAPFYNGSKIFAATHSENSLGIRANILMVDEYARCDELILRRVFLPFLTDTRKPLYMNLTEEERMALPQEKNRQLYLSSIKHAEEWSYKKFEKQIAKMLQGSKRHFTVSLPYHFGCKAGFINEEFISDYIEDNQEETPELIAAELLGIPERGSGSAFFKYEAFKKNRNIEDTLVAMSDGEYIQYKDKLEEWEYYTPKQEHEIRTLSMDIAHSGAKNSDNTIFFITVSYPNRTETRLKVDLVYGESMNGVSLPSQALRAKQLFYELQCDDFVIDCGGVGVSVAELCQKEIVDEVRGVTYPAWDYSNPDDIKNGKFSLDPSAVPIMHGLFPSASANHTFYVNAKKYLDSCNVSIPIEYTDALDYLITSRNYYAIKDESLRQRICLTYYQTNLLISECVNAEQITQGASGYVKLENKSTKRKDRLSSFCYNLYKCQLLERQYILERQNNQVGWSDFIF